MSKIIELAAWSTTDLRARLAATDPAIVLFPLGSVEPHGPHLPLGTDAILAEANAHRAARALSERGTFAVVAPTLPYGVTDFAAGFTGATTVPADALVALITAAAHAWLTDGFDHICLINHHLEPGQIAAVQQAHAAIAQAHGPRAASAPQVTSRRWGRQLTAEFKSGACHAGAYETSLVLAARPELVQQATAEQLPEVPISLSDAIQAGQHTFIEAGAHAAYTGQPSAATVEEGHATYEVLTTMVVTEVLEALEMHT